MIPGLMMAAGALLVAAAVSLDLLSLSDPARLSVRQALLAAGGIALGLNAVALRKHGGQQLMAGLLGGTASLKEAAVRYGAILLQLALLLLVMRRYQMESEAFYATIAALAAGGFAVHALLAREARQAFFLVLSILGIGAVLSTRDALWLLFLGGGIVGLGSLPVPWRYRVALVATAGLALAALRKEWLLAPWSRAVWPTLGAMFMFRIAVWLYDLKHGRTKPTLVQSLSYFFLLPNVVFPLFPVVDFAGFRRTWYARPDFAVYETGVRWMLRGAVQLILYRFVYQYMALSPTDVVTPTDLTRFMIANYLLYIRVSGQFHIITGMLHLFGFDLPLTNNRYFLASGFNDSWRRINIYWKDFMMKVVFYPSYFMLKPMGEKAALALGTALVVVVTWALHAYQWFWLLGSFPVRATDILFWGILGVFLITNTLVESKKGRPRAEEDQPLEAVAFLRTLGRTFGTFVVLSVLWSLWVSDSVGDWAAMLRVDWSSADWNTAALVLGVLTLLALAILTDRLAARWRTTATAREDSLAAYVGRGALVAASAGALWLAGSPGLAVRLGPRVAEAASTVRVPQLNRADATQVQRGYYENLMGVSQFNSQLWEVYMNRPLDMPNIDQTAAGRRVDSYLGVELVPSQRAVLRGAVLNTNRWGIRDLDYEKKKPEGALRIAMVGPSVSMGWAVGDEETFENLTERRLNRDRTRFGAYSRVESLNFSVPGYVPVQYLTVTTRALTFDPDVLMLVTQDNDVERLIGRLASYYVAGQPFPDDSMQAAVQELARGAEGRAAVERALKPHSEAILRYYYRLMTNACRERGVRPVWLFIPALERQYAAEDKAMLFRAARDAGFGIVDLSDVYQGQNIRSITIGVADFHPNPRGHRLIASRLFDALAAQPELLQPLQPPRPDPGPPGSTRQH